MPTTELDVPVEEIVRLAGHPKVVAIGEAGLDYFYDNSPREAQEQGFRNHIAAAQETQLPLVIHARDADDDMAAILEEEMAKGAFPAVLHCFTGGADLARRALDLGLYVSFSGILTFKKSDDLRAIAADVPLDRLLVETDAPYLAPGKYRGKRNEPAYVVETAQGAGEGEGRLAGGAGAGHDRQLLPALRQDAARRRWRHEHALHASWAAAPPAACRASATSGATAIRPTRRTAGGAARCWSSGSARAAPRPCWSTRRPTCASSC